MNWEIVGNKIQVGLVSNIKGYFAVGLGTDGSSMDSLGRGSDAWAVRILSHLVILIPVKVFSCLFLWSRFVHAR
jgi:hypothetical protein